MATRGTRAAAAVAGCAVVVAASFAFLGRSHGGDGSTAPVGTSPHLPRGALTGDVDGDGRTDIVSIDRTGRIRVVLGSGTTVRQLVPGGTRLEGLVDVGSPGLDLVTSPGTTGTQSSPWSVWHLHGHTLATLAIRHHGTIGPEPGNLVAWVTGHTLHDGVLDVLQKGQDRVAVLTRSWSLRAGELAPRPAGVRCWDRSTHRPPARCAPGQDWTYDVGAHGDLPELQPIDATWSRTASAPVVDGADSWTLERATPPGPDDAPRVDLVLHAPGRVARLLVPPGWAPALRPRVVTAGSLHGVLVSQEGGDVDTWRFYVDQGGRPVQLSTRGPLPLGGGFSHVTGAAYLSWVSAAGRVFTRVGTDRPGHYRVYEWTAAGTTAGAAPVLQAHDLGLVCFDDLYGHYGTCAR